ncbi:efflux RND transporter periplasmic adaptor subunit [Thalassotalea sp. LPB0316]|uniref:efflux RND transporter periplasmic adaptor subunit n=1 Tax=Thalassotalea sp. LPB0316 TaxID=2769490 RepID=UPI001868A987|nr:efflux RND transporter periplasmic adaptor subunit [Thalassotalea sp. LPB0316]QOL25684.1 efflux RND transporter periplasmic adaptor subunit [Thalassotalea sp. LPB0316]
MFNNSFQNTDDFLSQPRFLMKTCLSLSLLALLSACSEQNTQASAPPPPAVSVYQVKQIAVGQHHEFVARTEAYKEAQLTARVEGELIEKSFREGGRVKKGDVLLKIDPSAYQASFEQAQADLDSRESGFQNAIRNLKRANDLISQGYISQSDYDKLTTEESQAKAAVSVAKAALEKAELNLSYTHIVAPFDGRIGKANFDVGNVVGPQSGSLATLTVTDPIYVNFQVKESEYVTHMQMRSQGKREGQIDISLMLPNNTVYPEKGELDYADIKIDEGTGTVELRAKFPNPSGVILPGLFVNLVVESVQKEQMAYVPQSAVQENQQGKFVLVVDENNTVTQRIVQLGRRVNAMWVVESGLAVNEQVIIEGLQKVRPGIVVNPVVKSVDVVTGTISASTASEN